MSASYPLVYRWESGEYTEEELSEVLMEFRLTYEGPLLSTGNKPHPENVQVLRRKFHPQVKLFWHTNRALKKYLSALEGLAKNFERCGYPMVPLVMADWDLACALDILFLRRGDPVDLIKQGGDIDGRIKTV